MGDMGKGVCPNVLQHFLKTLTEGTATTISGGLGESGFLWGPKLGYTLLVKN